MAHREARRGRSGGAGQEAAHPSQAVRDAAATAGRRVLTSETPRTAELPPARRAGGRGLTACPSPPSLRRRSAPHSSVAGRPAPPRLGLPQRARRTPAHAPLPGARGLAIPGLAPPEPARESTRCRCGPAEGKVREAIGQPRPGRPGPSAHPGPLAAAGAEGARGRACGRPQCLRPAVPRWPLALWSERRTSKKKTHVIVTVLSQTHPLKGPLLPPWVAGRVGSPQRNQVKRTGSWAPRVLYLGQGL